mmetsp:Transcript_21750/g.58589  ORF Transcript_21750/g.58589 Transcript_21750/m.58589 type:complete len:205 (+) Transcript_21750:294-908(+)
MPSPMRCPSDAQSPIPDEHEGRCRSALSVQRSVATALFAVRALTLEPLTMTLSLQACARGWRPAGRVRSAAESREQTRDADGQNTAREPRIDAELLLYRLAGLAPHARMPSTRIADCAASCRVATRLANLANLARAFPHTSLQSAGLSHTHSGASSVIRHDCTPGSLPRSERAMGAPLHSGVSTRPWRRRHRHPCKNPRGGPTA